MDDSAYEGFTKRRRFLVGVSLGLAAAGFLGLRIEEISIVGNKAIVGNPANVAILGYLVWLWALVTYVQWFNDYGAWERTRSAFISRRDKLLIKAISKSEANTPRLETYKVPIRSNAAQSSNSLGPLCDQLRFDVRADGIGVDRSNQLVAICVMQAWLPTGPTGWQNYLNNEYYSVPVGTFLLITRSIRAIFELTLSTRYFTEYFAPFLIAVAPLLTLAHLRANELL
jgi:hypothetical protein